MLNQKIKYKLEYDVVDEQKNHKGNLKKKKYDVVDEVTQFEYNNIKFYLLSFRYIDIDINYTNTKKIKIKEFLAPFSSVPTCVEEPKKKKKNCESQIE